MQKNTCKKSNAPKAEKPGDRVHVDLSKVTVSRKDGSTFTISRKNWKLIVDEASGKKWSDFTPTKDGMVERTCEWMNQMKAAGTPIRIIRMDPAGENLRLEKRAQSVDWQNLQPVTFEITSRETPQHNSLVEVGFPYLSGLARAVMSAANIPPDVRGKVAIEALKYVTQTDGLVPVEIGGVVASRDEHIFGSNPNWSANLRIFGEAGVVKEGKDGKTGDRGRKMMFVGYPPNRESDSVKMWDPNTNGVWTTRDVTFLDMMFYRAPEEEFELEIEEDNPPAHGDDAQDEESEVELPELDPNEPDWNNVEVDELEARERTDDNVASSTHQVTFEEQQTTRTGRAVRAPTRLIETCDTATEIATTATAAQIRYLSEMANIDGDELNLVSTVLSDELEVQLVGAGIGGGFESTKDLRVLNHRQAMQSEDAEKWKDAYRKEEERLEKFGVFTPVKRTGVPKGAKTLSSVWANKRKSNGQLRARLNARGYEQINGQHFDIDSISAPVTNPISICIALTMFASNPDWIVEIIDVVGAFLQGRFTAGEQMFMELPEGIYEQYDREDTVLQMNVPIYGTKQAANCFYDRLVKLIKDVIARSDADPCMFFVWRQGRLTLMLSWVDDMAVFGKPEDVEAVRKHLHSVLECKDEGAMSEYVGSKIDITREESGIASVKFTQPVLVQKLREEFDFPGGRSPKTPAVAGQVLVQGDGSGALESQDATQF